MTWAANAAITIDTIRSRHELGAVAADWDDLAHRSAVTPFQSYPWHATWWDAVGSVQAGMSLYVVLVSGGHRARLIAPLMVEDQLGSGRTLSFLSQPWADYQDVLLDTSWEYSDAAVRALIDYLDDGMNRHWDRVVLCDVPASSPLNRRSLARSRHEWRAEAASICPRRHLSAGDLIERNAHRRRVLAQVQRTGPGRLHMWSRAEDIRSRMPEFMAMHVAASRRPGRTLTFTSPAMTRFYMNSIEPLANAELLCLAELRLDGRPAAFYHGFTYRSTFWGYRTAFDIELARRSPGKALHYLLFDHLFRTGFETFDMLRGDYAYKRRYATVVERTTQFVLDHRGPTGPTP